VPEREILDAVDIHLAGAVLCGGGSRRMGRDKALLPVPPGGIPLYRHVAGLVGSIADPVVLAPGTAGRLGETGYPEVADAFADSGPLAGLVAALEYSPQRLMAVVAVDMPAVSTKVLSLLAELCGECDAAVPLVHDEPEPLHAVYARDALPALAGALNARRLSLRGALESLTVRWIPEEIWRAADPQGSFALNLNSPADADAWRSARA
jgi:molybdopterin-guanine dinucleotide biosynthesis protein A